MAKPLHLPSVTYCMYGFAAAGSGVGSLIGRVLGPMNYPSERQGTKEEWLLAIYLGTLLGIIVGVVVGAVVGVLYAVLVRFRRRLRRAAQAAVLDAAADGSRELRRWWLQAVALPTIVIGVLWLWLGLASGQRLEFENWPKVKVGQTEAEVERLLGGPPGNYGRNAGGETYVTLIAYSGPATSVRRSIWCDDGHMFEVFFDAEDRVVGLFSRGYCQTPLKGGVLERLWRSTRSRLGI